MEFRVASDAAPLDAQAAQAAQPTQPAQHAQPAQAAHATPTAAEDAAGDLSDSDDDFDGWDEAQPTRSLFVSDETVYASVDEALKATLDQGCDLRALVARLGLDTLGTIRLINHVRRSGKSAAQVAQLAGDEPFLSDDAELQPVPGFEADGLLQIDFSDDAEDTAGQLRMLQQAYDELRRAYADRLGIGASHVDHAPAPVAQPSSVDSLYFDSYAGHDIHQTMIADSVRTLSYAQFILSPQNAHLIRGKTVMDVGCGSGILSLFCARAGAARVIAVDASDVAARAERNIQDNGFGHVVRVVCGKIEDLDEQLAPFVGRVDMIISEWMGYFLLYESMLPSVLYARDRYLAPSGVLAPSHSRMLLAAATDRGDGVLRERVRFWENVYGFSMPSMTQGLTNEAATEDVDAGAIVSNTATICDLPLRQIPPKQPEFDAHFELTITETCTVYGFVSWFDTWFSPDDRVPCADLPPCRETPIAASEVHGIDLQKNQVVPGPADDTCGQTVSFTTSPFGKPTHWKQTVFLLKTPLEVEAGTTISGEIRVHPAASNIRELDAEIHYSEGRAPGAKRVGTRLIQLYSVR
ncbi:type I protein arginine methyltransferase [Malassezia cuniculi]|uniref:type I protein arginine methyltransferase n=1 Tax=Malassezia cuniculi TaxID=948313 RepID=A0AAF0EYI2_9BASI|nr:type I protein arginine methyltransferase [Malassezia cuniculi]